MLTHLNNQLTNLAQVRDAGPYEQSTLGVPYMFARCWSGGCFCSFYLCFHEVVGSNIWYISFFCDCFTDNWRILNDSNWTLLVISVGSDAPSLGTLFSQVIAAQMKTWFDVMHVYVLKPQPFQKREHSFAMSPNFDWLLLADHCSHVHHVPHVWSTRKSQRCKRFKWSVQDCKSMFLIWLWGCVGCGAKSVYRGGIWVVKCELPYMCLCNHTAMYIIFW